MSSPGDAGKRSITSGFVRLKAGLENKRLLGLLVVEGCCKRFYNRARQSTKRCLAQLVLGAKGGVTQERRRWLPGKSRRQILGTCLTGEDIVEERRGFQTKGESLDPMLSQRLVSRQAADCRLAGAVLSHLLLRHVSLCDCPPHGGTSVYSVFWTKIFFTVVALSSYA